MRLIIIPTSIVAVVAIGVATTVTVVPRESSAKGCLAGAAVGGVAGHMAHHTFAGMFGGCAAGWWVHHLYAKWHKEHPSGTLSDFSNDYKGYLPPGWDERLNAVGDAAPPPGPATKSTR